MTQAFYATMGLSSVTASSQRGWIGRVYAACCSIVAVPLSSDAALGTQCHSDSNSNSRFRSALARVHLVGELIKKKNLLLGVEAEMSVFLAGAGRDRTFDGS